MQVSRVCALPKGPRGLRVPGLRLGPAGPLYKALPRLLGRGGFSHAPKKAWVEPARSPHAQRKTPVQCMATLYS